MARGRMRIALLTAALVTAVLLVLVGGGLASGALVVCFGPGGHWALEVEHRVPGCPEPLAREVVALLSAGSPGECVDYPVAGAGPVLRVDDRAQVPRTAGVPLALVPGPAPLFPAVTSAQPLTPAGPVASLAHLRTIVLLV